MNNKNLVYSAQGWVDVDAFKGARVRNGMSIIHFSLEKWPNKFWPSKKEPIPCTLDIRESDWVNKRSKEKITRGGIEPLKSRHAGDGYEGFCL